MKELNNGSIFCACIKDNFIQALVEFKKHQMDYLLIEASGISDPANLDKILSLINKDNFYEYLGNVCIIDGVYFTRLMKVYPVIEKQLASADLILLNKIDLLNESQIQECREAIQVYRPNVKIIESSHCKVSICEIVDNISKTKGYDEISMNTAENKPSSFYGEYSDSIPMQNFIDFIEAIKKESIRIKGYVKLDGQNYMLNVVDDTLVMDEFNKPLDPSKLVFISYQGTRYLSKILNSWKLYIENPLKIL